MRKLIAPSILSADCARLGEELKKLEEAGADLIHIDIMDGHFVPNLTMGPAVVSAIRRSTSLPLDVHLMVEEPIRFIDTFIEAGADWISVHVEGEKHLERVLSNIKASGKKAGVAYNPATPLEGIEYILHTVDFILIMTVNPGFGGQKMIEPVLEKVSLLKTKYRVQEKGVLVEVDGGVKKDNIKKVAEAGTDIFVSGSGILGSKDYKATIEAMRSVIDEI